MYALPLSQNERTGENFIRVVVPNIFSAVAAEFTSYFCIYQFMILVVGLPQTLKILIILLSLIIINPNIPYKSDKLNKPNKSITPMMIEIL
jgi:hypothetical protein